MNFLHPERLWLLALAVPLVLFHLRMRRRVRVVVPSLLALDPRDFASAPPRVLGFLPRDLLGLLLECAALAALALAFADPVEGSEPTSPRPLAIVLDGSASTLAGGWSSVIPSGNVGVGGRPHKYRTVGRFEEMRTLARRVVDAAGPDAPVSVLLAAGDVRVIVAPGETRDRFDRGLAEVRPYVIGAGALAAAADAAVASGAEVLVLTDGCDPDVPALVARRDMRLVSVGRPEENRGLAGVSVERTRGKELAVLLHIREADGSMRDESEVDERAGFGGGAPGHQTWWIRLHDGGSLAADDGVPEMPTANLPPIRVAVLAASGTVDAWLAAALESAGPLVDHLSVTVTEAAALRNLPRPPEVVVATSGAADPVGFPALVLGAGTGESVQAPAVQAGDSLHPVMRGVDPAELIVTRSRVLEARAGDSILLQGPTGPLVVAGTRDRHRRVLFGFDPRESTLPVTGAWPVLVRNALLWLGEETTSSIPPVVAAGSILELQVPEGVASVEVIGPGALGGNSPLRPRRTPAVGGKVSFRVPAPQDMEMSRMTVTIPGLPPAEVAIALLDAAESDLTPKIPRNADSFVPSVRAPRGPGPRSRAGDFALGGVGLLLLEWMVFALTGGSETRRYNDRGPRRDSFPGPVTSS